MAKLKEILGMEIGSVTINGETWAKVVGAAHLQDRAAEDRTCTCR